MPRKRYTAAQILTVVWEVDNGTNAADVSLKLDIGEPIIHVPLRLWAAKCDVTD